MLTLYITWLHACQNYREAGHVEMFAAIRKIYIVDFFTTWVLERHFDKSLRPKGRILFNAFQVVKEHRSFVYVWLHYADAGNVSSSYLQEFRYLLPCYICIALQNIAYLFLCMFATQSQMCTGKYIRITIHHKNVIKI